AGVARSRRGLRAGALPASHALAAAALGLGLADALGRGLDEAGQKETRRHGGRSDRARPAPHHRLDILEELVEAARADVFRELLEPVGGAVREGADVRAIVELLAGVAQRLGKALHRLRHLVLALVDVAGGLLLGGIDELAALLDGGAG